jgi:hypothetical protein
MSDVKFRPTFLIKTDLSTEQAVQRIKYSFTHRVDDGLSRDYHTQFNGHHAMISIDESKRHFWSPWMHLEVRNDDQQRVIAGRFSPHPSIWTAFMFAFLSLGCLTLFAAMFGVSQQMSGQSPWAYYFIPIGLLVAAVLWFISQAGQKLAHAEMEQMLSRIEASLDD